MNIKKKKRLIVSVLAIAILSLSGMTAFASSASYSYIDLPAFQGHITLQEGMKNEKGTVAASNLIDTLGNNNVYANCWVDKMTSGDRGYATDVTRCQLDTITKMTYINGYYWSGDVELRAYASNWGFSQTSISGYVNFDSDYA